MALYTKQAGAAARARMARRAKRARFIKQYSKTAAYAVVGLVLLAILAVMTPYGPGWVWADIMKNKMQGPDKITPGTFRRLYNLGVFYSYTMKPDEALRCFNEIGINYYSFRLSDYGKDPGTYQEQRKKAITQVSRGLSNGPPFQVDDSDLPYVSYAIYRIGHILDSRGGRQFTYNLYNDLYAKEFFVKYPNLADSDITKAITDVIMRYEGRK